MQTSLHRLSRMLDVDVESAREGVVNLLLDCDFTASIDITHAAEHQVFELQADWDQFHRSRITIHRAP
ncbi:MAG: hypothetical protein QOG10_3270 [Kribbellaceae bacterium]|nr:hypothetical protein [Kribbellaceae bacterium]